MCQLSRKRHGLDGLPLSSPRSPRSRQSESEAPLFLWLHPRHLQGTRRTGSTGRILECPPSRCPANLKRPPPRARTSLSCGKTAVFGTQSSRELDSNHAIVQHAPACTPQLDTPPDDERVLRARAEVISDRPLGSRSLGRHTVRRSLLSTSPPSAPAHPAPPESAHSLRSASRVERASPTLREEEFEVRLSAPAAAAAAAAANGQRQTAKRHLGRPAKRVQPPSI